MEYSVQCQANCFLPPNLFQVLSQVRGSLGARANNEPLSTETLSSPDWASRKLPGTQIGPFKHQYRRSLISNGRATLYSGAAATSKNICIRLVATAIRKLLFVFPQPPVLRYLHGSSGNVGVSLPRRIEFAILLRHWRVSPPKRLARLTQRIFYLAFRDARVRCTMGTLEPRSPTPVKQPARR